MVAGLGSRLGGVVAVAVVVVVGVVVARRRWWMWMVPGRWMRSRRGR